MSNVDFSNWCQYLSSPKAQDREMGWLIIRESTHTSQARPNKEELLKLIRYFQEESNPTIHDCASGVLMELMVLGPEKKRHRRDRLRLANWFWCDYERSPSIAFFPFDPDFIRRDTQATVELARHLATNCFPTLVFEEILLGNVNWGDIFKNRRDVGALLFVGRLGMYGAEAIERWGHPHARLHFGCDIRPTGLSKGQLDPVYHSIDFRSPSGEVHDRYVAHKVDNKLIDFGLVQRYPVNFDARQIPVTICQGCTELGTLAAVQFAIGLEKAAIRLREPAKESSCFEALVRVSAADANDQRSGWRPDPKDLKLLFLDNLQWESNKWLPQSPKTITIVRGQRGQPVAIRLDDRHNANQLQPETEGFRMVVALCDESKRNARRAVLHATLAKKRGIWDEKAGKSIGASHVRKRYGQLRDRNLGRAIEVTNEEIVLHADVRDEALDEA